MSAPILPFVLHFLNKGHDDDPRTGGLGSELRSVGFRSSTQCSKPLVADSDYAPIPINGPVTRLNIPSDNLAAPVQAHVFKLVTKDAAFSIDDDFFS